MVLGYKKTLEAMKRGETLMITHPDPQLANRKTLYGLMPSGKQVSDAAYRKIRPQLRPSADGLFGTEIPQTYEWVSQ